MYRQLGLRKNEGRLNQLGDFDVTHGIVLVHGKGGKEVVLPLGFDRLKEDVRVYLIGRDLEEYLLYPRDRRTSPMDPSSIHR